MVGTKQNRDILKNYWIYFIIYSFIGWIYETALDWAYGWGFNNRGYLFGPWLPIYGTGSLVFLFTAYRLIRNKSWKKRLLLLPLVFLLCMLIATSLELAASYILEAMTGSWDWQTYTDYPINFQGRIALSPSLRFGLGGVVFLYIGQPLLELFTSRAPARLQQGFFLLTALLFAGDLVFLLVR